MIDDALGWSDPQRLQSMGAAIASAGKQCQIVILTCYPGGMLTWEREGGQAVGIVAPTASGFPLRGNDGYVRFTLRQAQMSGLGMGGLAEGAGVAGAAGYALLVQVFEEGEDVFAAGVEEGAGLGDGDAAVVFDVAGDGFDHLRR